VSELFVFVTHGVGVLLLELGEVGTGDFGVDGLVAGLFGEGVGSGVGFFDEGADLLFFVVGEVGAGKEGIGVVAGRSRRRIWRSRRRAWARSRGRQVEFARPKWQCRREGGLSK
jgi:hypothetical protein